MNGLFSTLYTVHFSPESEESDSSVESEQENEEPVSSTIVDPGIELPPEIDTSSTTKSWLYRRSRTPSPKEGDDKTKKQKRKRLRSSKALSLSRLLHVHVHACVHTLYEASQD